MLLRQIATAAGNISAVQVLLSRNDMNVNQQDKRTGRTVLHVACDIGETEIFGILLGHPELDVNQPDNNGKYKITNVRFYFDELNLLI